MKHANFQAYLSKLQIKYKSNSSGSSQDIQIVLDDINNSDHDLNQLKNIKSDAKVSVMINPTSQQLSLEDIEKERKRTGRRITRYFRKDKGPERSGPCYTEISCFFHTSH